MAQIKRVEQRTNPVLRLKRDINYDNDEGDISEESTQGAYGGFRGVHFVQNQNQIEMVNL